MVALWSQFVGTLGISCFTSFPWYLLFHPIVDAMGSPVVLEWEKLDYIVALGQKGQLGQYTNRPKVALGGKNKQIQVFNRRDVVNNADILGPLINHMGT